MYVDRQSSIEIHFILSYLILSYCPFLFVMMSSKVLLTLMCLHEQVRINKYWTYSCVRVSPAILQEIILMKHSSMGDAQHLFSNLYIYTALMYWPYIHSQTNVLSYIVKKLLF